MDQRPNKQLIPPSWWWLMLPMLFWLTHALVAQGGAPSLAYSDFKKLVNAGKIRQVSVADETIRGLVISEGLDRVLPRHEAARFQCKSERGCPFRTTRIADPELVRRLEVADVRVVGEPGSDWLPFILVWGMPLAAIGWMIASLGKKFGMPLPHFEPPDWSRAWIPDSARPRFDLRDFAGNEEAKARAEELVAGLRDPEHSRRVGGVMPKGALITGAPGTGKTLLAHAIAGEARVPLLTVSGPQLLAMPEQNRARQVCRLFLQAQRQAPCVLFIDELDALGGTCEGTASCQCSERQRLLNLFMAEIDNFDHSKGMLVLAAAVNSQVLDPALFKTGRIECQIHLEKPHVLARETILATHAASIPLGQDVNLAATAARTAGLSGGQLGELLNQAAVLATQRNRKQVGLAELEQALAGYSNQTHGKARIMTPLERQTMAYHEAGHALIAHSQRRTLEQGRVSIIPGNHDSHRQTRFSGHDGPFKKQELLERLDLLLGGLQAEALAFGEPSSVALADLQEAKDLALRTVTYFGAGTSFCNRADEQPCARANSASGLELAESDGSGEKLMAEEACKLLRTSRERVNALLAAHRTALDIVAKVLMEQESLPQAALNEMIRKSLVTSRQEPAEAISSSYRWQGR